jgi:hypothetical protein
MTEADWIDFFAELERRMSPEVRAEMALAHEEYERRKDELRAYLEGTEWTPEQRALLEARMESA